MELHPTETHDQQPDPLKRIFFNERGLRAGWRLLIFIAIVVLIQLTINTIIALLRHNPARLGPNITPFAVLPTRVIGVAVLLFAAWIMGRIEHREIGVYGLPLKNSNLLSRFVAGYLFWGFLPLAVLLLIMRALHVFYFGELALRHGQIFYWGFIWFLVFLFVALFEEYFLRGYLLYTLADGIGFWPAAIFLAAIFGFLHALNPGESRIGIIMTVVFALFASITLWRTGNLWLAVGAHAGWDWGESYFFGTSDSGLPAQGHLLNSHIQGAAWLSGGSVGPEGSILALFLLLGMSAAATLLLRKRSGEPTLVITPSSTIFKR